MESLVEIFCDVDDFCQAFLPTMEKKAISSGKQTRNRERLLTISEIMTILILFHQSSLSKFQGILS